MARINDLGRDRIGPLLWRLVVPATTAQLVNALYNIVDRIYIGRLPGEGSLALTGLGVCFPVLMLITALSSLIGTGGGARASIYMGANDTERAERILGTRTTSLVILAVVSTVLLQIFCEPMLMLFGGSSDTIGYATDYMRIYLCGSLFVLFSLGLNPFLTAQGFTNIAMKTVIIGAICNIVLDPIFIYLFDMGVRGAALATILSQLVSMLWVLRFLTGTVTKLKLRRAYLRLDWKVLAPVLALGVSPFVMQGSESVLIVAFNASLKHYGGDLAVGAMTIVSSITQVRTMILQGVAQGAQPILGYNYGAGNSDRVRKAFRLALISSVLLSVFLWLIVFLFPTFFVHLFNSENPELTAYSVWALNIYSATLFVMGAQFTCQQSFLALGQAKVSLIMAVLRKFILLIPLILILPFFFTDKVFAVFLAEPISDFIAASVTCITFFICLPRILSTREAALAQQKK